ncbi:ESPR-type extended signal peptide-containing protein [Acinetobacter seifertii]|uniref:YadA-like family protein n=5 Tax=Acinetobacter calcoaceticus/baumannii complex TaxID=909768 RepID=A0A7H2VA80_9GAMM|nr:ESPR-type extended signal peptide-containing protein [Acinetobacter seifertii]QNX73263.1 YadA-like family protein [Acinetobacter seifertii]
MNKIYKVVWNASIGTWTVVSELAKSKTRTGSVSSSTESSGQQNEIVSREKRFRPKALVLSIISCLAVSHVWADYTNLYGSIIDTSPTISNGIAIGANTGTPATANDSNGLAVGSRANASAADSTALGNYVNATGVNSTVVGGQASAAGAQSIALQNNSDADLVAEGLATGSSFTAVDSASSYSVAIGAMSQVVGSTAAMAIGKNAQVNSGANNATAIGNTATVDTNAVDGIAIGTNSLTSAANSVALGPRSTANVTNSVALGAGSTTTVQSGNSYITNVAASTTNGVVSVGSATNTRRIQNVADGAADSDAVTVAQLKDVNNRAVGNTTALGGGAAYNPATDVYTPPSYTITKTDGTTYTPVNTVSGALTNLNNEVVKPITFAGNTGSSANNLGTTLNITGGGSTAGTYSGNNLKTAVTGNTVNIQMADAPVFSGTVTAGNLTTGGSLNVTGASNLNGGANLNNQKITNLAAGTISASSTDAVNGSQLNTTNQNVTTAQNTANTAVTNAAAAQNTANTAVTNAAAAQNTANTAVTNAAAAQATADKGLNFSVNGGTADNVKLGETVNFANGTNTTAVYDPATNTYKYNVNDNISLTNAGSLTVGNAKVDNSGLTITGGPSVTTAGINAGNQKITNVAAGTISASSTDAVNGSQLNTTNQNVTTAQNTANTAVTNAAAAQNTANTAVTNAAAAQATADKGLNFSVNGGTADNVKLGETVNFANGTNTTAVYDPTTNTYKYNVNDNISLTNAGSLTVGNSKVDNSGLTITGGPSVTTAGINAANQKITNVAAGTISASSTDAVNGSQLNTTNQNVTTAQNTANTAVTNAAAAQNTANTAVTNAAAAQTTANTAVTNAAAAQATADKGLNFSVNGGTADNVKLGETVNFANGTNTTAVYDPATNTYKYNVNDNIALTNAGSLTVGNSKVDNSGLTITGGPSVTTAGINAANQKITNVAAGTISASSTDAVNGSQLNTTNQNVTTAQNTANTAVTNAAAAQNTANTAVTNAAAAQNTANTAVTNAAAAQATADKGLNFSVNGGTADNVKLGETVNFANGTNTTAVYDPATNTYKYNVNDNISLTNAGSLTVGNSKVDNSGLTITGGPSVTTAGINAGNQKITNVAAGTISASSTDAVNGSQLNTTNQNVTTAQNTANTAVTNAAAAQNTANTAVTNAATAQATADKGLNFSVNGGTADNVKLGETVNFANGTNTTAVYDPATNTYKYNVNDNIALTNAGSLTVGNSKVDNSGLTITGGPSVTTAGINAANQKITNVAAGTNSTDAVNVSQLDALSTSSNNKTDALGNSTANNLGGGASYDSTTGAVSSPTYTVNGNNVNNVGDAITALDKGWTLQSNGSNAAAVKAGDTVDIGTVAGETNLKVTKTGNTIQYGLNRDLDLDSVTTGDSKLDSNGLTIAGGPSVTKTGIDAAGNTISNVAAGTNATDAVNKGQLDALSTSSNNKTDALGTSTANNLGGGASYDSTTGAVSSPTYVTTKTDGTTVNASNVGDALTNLNNEVVKPITFAGNSGSVDRKLGETLNITGGLTASGSNSNVKTVISGNTVDIQLADAPVFAGKLTANGLDANGEKVTNVGAGTNATDAVNKGQLDALSTSSNNKTDALGNSTANNLGGGSSYDSTTGAVSSPTYTVNGNNVNNVGDAITALDKGWTLQSNGSNAAAVKAGDTVDIGTVAGETNLKVTKTGNTIQYGLNRDLDLDSVTTGDSKLDSNGLTIAGGPSVTKTGIDAAGNTISNVAAGTNATDAVNKGQLDALSTSSNNKTDALGTSTANNLGGGASYDSTTGAVSSPTYVTTKTDGTTVNASNVGDALTNLNNEVVKPITFAGNSGSVDRKLGETLNITGGLTASGSNSNVKTVISGNTVDIQLADAPVFAGKLTANGLDANGEKVTNVGAGTNATDAVNKGQLDALSTSSNNKTDALGNSTANNLGGGSSYDSTTGAVSSPTYTVNGNNVNNVGDAITALDKGWTLQSNGSNAAAVKAGDTVDIGTVAGETNLKVTKTGNTIQYGLNRDLDLDSVTTGDSKLDSNGLTIAGGPSVTKTGIDAAGNTISNVAAGTNATDAVNKGQLDALSTSSNNKTDALGNSTANNLGGGASYDSTTGAVSSPTYVTTKTDGTTVNASNVGDALTNLNNEVVKPITFAGNSGSVDRKLGETLNITGGLTASGSNSNVKTVISGNTVDIQLADAPVFAGKLTANGLDANGEKVTNVGAGTNATDAVNKGQLDALSTSSNNKTDALGNSTANNLGGGSSYDSTTGAVSSPTYTVNGNNVNNVGDAITALDKGWTLQSNGSNAAAVKAGDTVDIGTVAGETNLKVTKTGNTIQYGLNRDLDLDSVTTGDSKLDSNGLTIAGGPSVTKTGIDAAGNTISNVAAGTNATDAVNKGQLDALSTSSNNKTDALGNSTANNLGGGASYDSTTGAVSSPTYTVNGNNVNNVGDAITALDKGWTLQSNGSNAAAVKAGDTVDIGTVAGETNLKVTKTGNTIQYGLNRDLDLDSVTTGDSKLDSNGLTIAGGPSVTKTGIDAAGNTISNVAAGTNATDAVNKGQLDALSTSSNNKTDALGNSTANNLGGGASYDSTTGAVSSPTYVTTKTDGTTVNASNVGDALTNLNNEVVKPITFAGNSGSVDRKLGETLNITGGLTASGSNSNVKTVISGNTVDIQLADAPVFAGKLTANGLDANGEKVTNVGAGTAATDAVNKGQLDALSTSSNNKTDALGNSTANNLGGGASYDSTTGAVSSPTYTVNGNNVNNVGDAITALDKGWTLQSNGSNAAAVKAGDTVDIGTVAGETNLKVTKTGNTIQYGLNRDLDLDSVTTGDSKLDSNGLTIAGGPSVTKTGIDAAGNTISNVAAGTNATDAVNKGQLDALSTSSNNKTDALGNSTANNFGGGASYDSTTGAVSSPTYVTTKTDGTTVNASNVGDALTNLNNEVVKPITFAGNSGSVDRKLGETLNITGGLTASGSNSNVKTVISGNTVDIQLADAPVFAGKLTANGLDANGEKVTNVGAGTAATDAVNKGQLDALSTSSNNKTDALGNSTANNLGGGSSYDSTTGAVSSPTYTVNGNNVNNVGDAITALDKGWTLQSNGSNAAAIKAGDTVDIGTVAGETNLKVTKTGNTIQYGLNRDLDLDSVTTGDSKLDSNGLTIAGGPSVTKTGIDAAGNTISNVAAGTNTTDAVNKGQLDHVDNRVTQVTNTTASIFGGGAKANTDGSISNPTYNVAGTSANNVGDALTALDKAVTDAGNAANAGWTVSANGDGATAKNIKPNGKVNFTGDDNLTVAQTSETDNEGNIKVALNKNLKVDSVTTGNTVIDTTGVKVGDNVQLGSTGLIIAGGPSITTSGISAGNKTISNVAAGVSSTDAVNKGQLDSAISSINNNVGALANSAVQYDKNSDGSVNKDSITLAGGTNGTTIKNVANGTIAEGSKDAVNGGQLWTVQQQVNKNTGDISNLQTDISNINNGKSGLVQQADKDAAITVGKDTGGTQVNVAGTAGDRTVTGVKAGAVTATSKDAVNGSQLNTTNQALVNYLGGGAGYDNITQSFSNPTYNVGDKSYNNVGDAIGALNQADQTLNTKIDNVSNKLEQAFYATNQRIDDVEKRANAGIAAAMALENAPFVAGKYTYAVGAAYHGGENAVGVTLRKTADNGRWSLTGGVAAASQGDPSVRIGISGVID